MLLYHLRISKTTKELTEYFEKKAAEHLTPEELIIGSPVAVLIRKVLQIDLLLFIGCCQ